MTALTIVPLVTDDDELKTKEGLLPGDELNMCRTA
jgi:hypothetical protein